MICSDCYDGEDEPLPRYPCAFERVHINLTAAFGDAYDGFALKEELLERVAEMLHGDHPWYAP